jgi:hypothetical protein
MGARGTGVGHSPGSAKHCVSRLTGWSLSRRTSGLAEQSHLQAESMQPSSFARPRLWPN